MRNIIMAAVMAAGAAFGQTFVQHLKCDLETATGASLPPRTISQGTTPLWSVDLYRAGQPVATVTDGTTRAVIVLAQSATGTLFAAVSNTATTATGYTVQWPVVGTNSGGATAAPWWYMVLLQTTAGKTYWTGSGRLTIEPSNWSGLDGLGWGASPNNYAILIAQEAAIRSNADVALGIRIDNLVVGAGLSTNDCNTIVAGILPTATVAYATSAGTATTALGVAWSGITGRPDVWSGTATDDVARAGAVALTGSVQAAQATVNAANTTGSVHTSQIAALTNHAATQTNINASVSSGMGSLTTTVVAANTTGATHTAQIATNDAFREASTVHYSTNSGNAATVGGLTAEDIMRVGLRYYFTTNLVSYGAVTGRSCSLSVPTNTQIAVYPGPVTNGQYIATYLVRSNDMPEVILKGIYSFEFNGYHAGTAGQHPRIGADIYIVTASNGVVVQEFENTAGKEVPRSTEAIPSPFVIQVNVTNDIPRDGYAIVLKTKMIERDGYNGDLYSYFGRNYWSGFITPVLASQFPTRDEVDVMIDEGVGVVSTSIVARDGAAQDPTGWTQEDGASWTFATNTRTLTVTGLSGLWVNGVSNPVSSVTAQIGTNAGLWYIYAPNGTTNFMASQTAWSLFDGQLATVYNDNDGGARTNYVVADETHTAWMQWRTHRRFHMVPGTAAAYASGLTLTMSAVNSWNVSAGVMFDEDIMHSLPLTNACWIAHRRGSFGRMQGPTTSMFATNGAGAAVWDNAGTLQAVSGSGSANYFSMWVYALDLHTGPSLIVVVGQSVGTLATIRAELPPANLANVVPGAEAVLLYQVILRGTTATYTEAKDYRLSKVTSSAALSEVDPVWSAAKTGIEASIATAQATADAGNTTGALHTAQLSELEGRTNVWNNKLSTNGNAIALTNFPQKVVQTNQTDVTFAGWRFFTSAGLQFITQTGVSGTFWDSSQQPAMEFGTQGRWLFNNSGEVVALFGGEFSVGSYDVNLPVYSTLVSLQSSSQAQSTTTATHTAQLSVHSNQLAYAWQGAQVVPADTNLYEITYTPPAVFSNNQYELLPYSTTNYGAGVTGIVTITMKSNVYLASISGTWNYTRPGGITPQMPVSVMSSYESATTAVLSAYCSQNPGDAYDYYYAYFSNLVVYTYDRVGMTTYQYTNDAAGVIARVDPLPEGNTDDRRVVNQESLSAAIAAAKPDIAKEAWSYTPTGARQPSTATLTIDKPMVQSGQMAYLQSGDYFAASYQGGDWYNTSTGSAWRLGPGGRVAFEVTSTNRMLFIQAFSVATNWATIDIATNWITGTPYVEFCQDLAMPQWLAAPSQIVTSNADFWRVQCPASATQRFYRAVSPGGANAINSYYPHNFPEGITVRGVSLDSVVTPSATTNIVREITGRFAVTNLVSITNTTRFTVTLPANACSLDDIRVYAANANISSRRYRIRLSRAPSFRRTDLAYVATNCLLYATTSTVAQAVGSATNVVNDASGIVWPIDMYWHDYGGGTNDWMSYTNATATVISQCCTNNFAAPVGTLISRVEQFGGFNYFDATGGTGAYFEYDPTTGMTGSIYVAIGGFKK